ncbi:amidohydrolase [Flavobacterium sp. ZT3R18]|uniref:amidohydrolase n=1 Tax=Flavobacterium sp. ZT3R18 TaxID=2594429 RepID=UPI00117A99E3|nr:amidohydrolase [Flavobacterium sp. ZT3R18]TRX37246.1 amidohydrolase [Flavobacterium sp. ZT3R18]
MKKSIAVFLLLALVSCKKQEVTNPADTIYFGGDIVTMEGNDAVYAEAIAVKNGKILFVGTKSEAEKFHGDATEMKNLEGKTLLPGFIDSHSHLGNAMNIMGQANVSSAPVGNCATIADIIAELQKCKKNNNIKDGEWIFGWGYDDTQLAEKRHPTKMDLDKYFPNNPVYIQHVSGHLGVANSLALADAKFDKNTKDPAGGMILRLPGTTEPSGVLQEMAVHHFVEKVTEVFASQKPKLLQKALDLYAKNGITTAQEGFSDASTVAFLKQAAKEKKISIDVVSLPSFLDLETNVKDSLSNFGEYHNHLKLEGTKIVADGSPQGKTAFFTKPFLTEVPGCSHDCKGFSNVTQAQLNKMFEVAYKSKMQLFVHCNGDATIDMLLLAHETACKNLNQPLDADRRTIVIHSNFVRKGQLEKYKKYNISPSFFTNHAYFWGDVHVENLGKERAFFLSPIHTADSLGIIYTNHTDYIITPINQLFTIWSSVNRVSRSGKIIGANERTTAYQGLKAITINGAYQYFEEKTKGSLKEGKLADLVILDQNPLKVDKMKIKEILVVETIKEGKSVYKKKL